MKKSLVGKLGMLALLAGAVGAAGVGCSGTKVPGTQSGSGSEGPQGSVGLDLVPVSGVTLNSVHYVITNSATPAVTVSEGDLPTPGTAHDFSFGLSLPVGTGYSISLSAASAETNDNITCGGAFGPFNVAPNQSTAFTLTLTCHDDTNGQIIGGVDVKTDACPKIVFDYVVATPAAANVGSPIAVLGQAHDLDGKPVTYAWTIADPAVGTFAPTTGATSTLTCNAQGSGTLVTITANNGECTKTLSTTVSCNNVLCGNGVVDPGETCDKGIAGVPCPADCTFLCGDGTAEAPAEDCDPGNTAACDATCHFRAPLCNDGFLTAPEPCDGNLFPPGTETGSTCATDCSAVIPPAMIVCGDSMIGGTETCDDGGPSRTCSNTCFKVSTQACVDCENAGDCFESVDNCTLPGFSAAQQTQCFAVMGCIEASNCLDGTGSLGKCYCGSLSTAACGAAPFTGPGSPDGACKAEIQAGMPGITTNSAVLGGLTANSRPAGAAMQRLNCQKTANGSACLDTCGLAAGGPVFP